ncbi:MAG: MlaD family protein [Verrucomicrobiales bacterium]|nr:MlaD family protein [Verrucomicrobiales bacterium]
MPAKSHRPEISVGLFVLVGFFLLGWLLLQFAKSGSDRRGGYPITVEVRDASGIRDGVPVRLGGIDIGTVSARPQLNSESTVIEVPLTIYPDIKIPAGSAVQIATSGLMGDSFVRILPPAGSSGEFIEEGARIRAAETKTINDLTTNAGTAIEEVESTMTAIRDSVQHLNEIFTRIEKGVLNETNIKNLSELLVEMRTLSDQLKTATEDAGPLLKDTSRAINSVNDAAGTANKTFAKIDGTMQEFNKTLGTINPAVTEFDESLGDLRGMIATVNALVKEIDQGDGLAAALINDRKLKADLEEFVTKLNKNGVLFYPKENGILERNRPTRP